jgi:predicted RNA-binding protein Jag
MGKVLAALEKNGEPILLEKGRRPVGVIISIRDYQERFAERAAAEARERVLKEIDSLTMTSADSTPVVDVLREMRGED